MRVPPEMRRFRYVGTALLAAFAIGIAFDAHPPGTHGRGLAIAIAFGGYLLALAVSFAYGATRSGWELASKPPTPARASILFLLAVSSTVLFTLQKGGYGVIGIYIAACVAGLRYTGRTGTALLVVAVVGFDVGQIVAHDGGPLDVASSDVGLVMLFLVMRFAGRARESADHAAVLLAELEQSRDAQAAAAAISERGRIAREMHDVLAHSLSALAVQLEGARLLARDRRADPDVVEAIEKAHHLAGSGLEEARRTIETLRDEDLPGPARLAALAESFGEQAGVETSFDIAGDARELSSEARLALYRTAQEALTNVRKHARPERVDLSLRYGEEGTSLVVEDHAATARNGTAVNGALTGTGGGYGLSGMRERAELLGGRLLAAPTSDGFRVELWLPA